MSTNIYWLPNVRPEGYILPKGLKFILAPVYLDHDGSLSGTFALTKDTDANFLLGIMHGTQDKDIAAGVRQLLDALDKYGSVLVELRG